MKLLIIGGTKFLGRHFTEIALARGHDLTHFNRGSTGANLYPQVETIHGDRTTDIEKLAGRTWDAVIDTCGYFPRDVRASANFLADKCGYYAFISTVSVYPEYTQVGMDENAPVATIENPEEQTEINENYGALKALCEQAAEAAMPGRVLNVRSGLLVGEYDPSDRFTYWVHRVAQGGEVLAPSHPDAPISFIDARDLASWTLDMIEANRVGTYNVTGVTPHITMAELLNIIKRISGSDATFTWASEPFLLEKEVAPWMGLPLWIPDDMPGFHTVSYQKALDAGLKFRPVEDTVRDTLAWKKTRPADHTWRAGLSPEKEKVVLEAWHAVKEGA